MDLTEEPLELVGPETAFLGLDVSELEVTGQKAVWGCWYCCVWAYWSETSSANGGSAKASCRGQGRWPWMRASGGSSVVRMMCQSFMMVLMGMSSVLWKCWVCMLGACSSSVMRRRRQSVAEYVSSRSGENLIHLSNLVIAMRRYRKDTTFHGCR